MLVLSLVPLVRLIENGNRDPLPLSLPLPSLCGAHPLPLAPNLTELAFYWHPKLQETDVENRMIAYH